MKVKKALYASIVICLAFVLTLTSTANEVAAASTFADVKESHYAVDAVEWAAKEGIVGGYADGTFRPNALLTEAQFTAMLKRYYLAIRFESTKFTALDSKAWSNSAYEGLSRFQVPLLGYTNFTYRNEPIKRGLLAQILSYVNGESLELEKAIQYLYDEKITVGQNPKATDLFGNFGALNNLSRSQAVIFFHRLHTSGKVEVAHSVRSNKVLATAGSTAAEEVKIRALNSVDPRLKPVENIGVGGYIEGQQLPVKPTYVKGHLIANKKYPLPKNFAPGESKEARAQFNKMVVEARKSNLNLTAFSTYRSFSYQTTLYDKYVKRDGKAAADRYSARPGYSEHQTGLAFDIGQVNQQKHWAAASFGTTKAGLWVAKNAHRYGFVMRYPNGKEKITGYMHESWHFRYVGQHPATEIYKKGITLEEYVGPE